MTLPNIRFEDDSATVPFVAKNGYYIVGDKNFNFKFNALMHATKTQQDVRWEFNTPQFRALDWRTPLNVDIRTLYRQRAQQLRDNYDYLMLCFSGGSDSTTILKSFINNGIHLDEIICDWPLKHTSNWSVSNDPTSFNHISEWELSIRPMLDYVRTHHPLIKITITDTTEDLSVEDNEHAFTISHMGPYQSTKRYKNVAQRFSEINKKHDRAAIILGCDKPNVFIEKNIFCVIVEDVHCFFKSSHVPENRVVEYFYWSGDMPEIVREQAYLIYQHVLANPQLKHLFVNQTENIPYKQNLIKSIIYPDWDINIFQANKADSTLWSSQHAWIMREKTPALDAWQSTLNSHINMIDPKYFTFYPNSNRVHGIKTFYSRAYPIGVVPNENTMIVNNHRYISA
jgi:hypothetical protein